MNQTIYIGPDIRGVVARNQIFTYRPEAVIAKASVVEPLAKYLFVPMDDIVNKKRELDRRGSLLNKAYQNIMKKS